MQWTFENYRLDADNAVLWKGEEQIVLRPKTFDVLRYLVIKERPKRTALQVCTR